MSRKLALKRLKPSDLSFFQSYLIKHPQAKQKGFNLDSSVMEGVFFPALKASLEPLAKKATHIDLMLSGPGLAEAHSLARKIKIDSKNIRLNGEVIHGTDAAPDVYDVLEASDFAVMEFVGAAMPTAVKVVLIAAGSAEDAPIHAALQRLLPDPNASMKVLSDEDIDGVVSVANPSINHPIRDWLDSELMEEVGHGDSKATEKLAKRRPSRGISPSDFKASKESAERIGRLGEELLDQHLKTSGWPGVSAYEWVAQINAISPFDFLFTLGAGGQRHVDAKSTAGKFSNPIYLSMAEIRHAISSGSSGVPYDLVRLYGVTDDSATFRVAENVGPKLVAVLESLKAIPFGVSVDSLSFDPSFFGFGATEHHIHISDGSGTETAA